MSYVIKRVSQFPKNKIIGSGTSLDTARFEFFLSRTFDVAHKMSMRLLLANTAILK